MRKYLACLLCIKHGYSYQHGYYGDVLLLAVDPNRRSGPKPWVCRKCIKKHSKLTDREFLELINKAIQQKP